METSDSPWVTFDDTGKCLKKLYTLTLKSSLKFEVGVKAPPKKALLIYMQLYSACRRSLLQAKSQRNKQKMPALSSPLVLLLLISFLVFAIAVVANL